MACKKLRPLRRGDNPIHLAARRGKLEIIKKMVQAGANVDQQNQVNGDTPLHTAMQVGAQESMEALLIVGAKTNVLNRDGKKAEGVARDNVIKDSLQVRYGKRNETYKENGFEAI
ncbi:DAPK1-like protein [Mya arenaria]|uniref:DAPK1-like protein n=1 Tax=Mya arenaria TaxID=6604 RepID=A0ABY7DNC5_MYAAR|nr:DAPK1-like protein [Mya arenaria]